MRIALKNFPKALVAAHQAHRASNPTLNSQAPTDQFVGNFTSSRRIDLNSSILDTSKMSLDTFKGPLDEYGSFLVLDVEYEQVKEMRKDVESVIGRKLDFLKLIRPEGEAHVTTFTPVEAQRIIAREKGEPGKITMDEVEKIANSFDLSDLDLTIQGVGSGSKMVNGQLEETFFLIADSKKLRKVRKKINELYLSKGGDPEKFTPEHFFPHITIGYTWKDLHEIDGVIKNKENSLDSRFDLRMENSR